MLTNTLSAVAKAGARWKLFFQSKFIFHCGAAAVFTTMLLSIARQGSIRHNLNRQLPNGTISHRNGIGTALIVHHQHHPDPLLGLQHSSPTQPLVILSLFTGVQWVPLVLGAVPNPLHLLQPVQSFLVHLWELR